MAARHRPETLLMHLLHCEPYEAIVGGIVLWHLSSAPGHVPIRRKPIPRFACVIPVTRIGPEAA
jgi:hypothetical protein